jgi:hypothetical protein
VYTATAGGGEDETTEATESSATPEGRTEPPSPEAEEGEGE